MGFGVCHAPPPTPKIFFSLLCYPSCQSLPAMRRTGKLDLKGQEDSTMAEAEWLASTDPTPMLEFLRGKANDRKLRLFACACCYKVWLLLDGRCRKAIEAAEGFADGRVALDEMETASFAAENAS